MEHKTERPLVSVIIPAYNAENTICAALDSVFAQTHTALQVLVVDDASTDTTLEKIMAYQDPRLEVIRHTENKHLVESRNTALAYVKGDYVAFLDSDDIWTETKIEKQLAFLQENPDYGACFTWGIIIDENGNPHPLTNPEICTFHSMFHERNRSHREWFFRFLTEGNCLMISSALVRADIIRQIGPQNVSLLQLQDFEYWIRVLSCSNLHILEEELTKYRRIQDGNALSSWTDDINRRATNETNYVISHLFDYIADDLFVSLFREDFLCPDSCTETELLCEKAFFLKEAVCGQNPYLDRIQQLLSSPEGVRVLSEKFHYTPKFFYAENIGCRYADDALYLQKQQECVQLRLVIKDVEESWSWWLTAPLRKVNKLLRGIRSGNVLGKVLFNLRTYGLRITWEKIRSKYEQHNQTGALWERIEYPPKELDAQRKRTFSQDITFSILVPLYNTPQTLLREMIGSVLDQTYANWELCLADGSDDQHTDVEQTIREYMQRDPRIRYRKLEQNLGISGNTNACIDMATGDYVVLFDHDDHLHPAALFEVMRAICEKNADFIYTDEVIFRDHIRNCILPHYKPDYAPDTLRTCNYICHMTTVKKSLLDSVGKFRPECDGSQDYDMVLRLTEKAERIVHIPKILYYWRAHPGSVADSINAKPYVFDAAKRGIQEHLQRMGLKGEVLDSVATSMYRVRYEIEGKPLISILIPNCDCKPELEKCLNSIFYKSTYSNFEVIIIENNSKSREIFEYYRHIQNKWENLKVVTWDGPFNYSAINNYGAQFAAGEHLLLLNNDTEVISPDWIQEMLMFSQRSDVGAVGAKLYYPDNTIQHGGVILGLGGVAGHSHKNFRRRALGYMNRLVLAQNLSAVTAACIMIRRQVWDAVNGLDPAFEVAFNDVDLCMRIRQAGYLIVWTPYAELYHHESKSRGLEDTPEKQKRFQGEVQRFQKRWAKELAAGDPYYNPNFTLTREDFSLR